MTPRAVDGSSALRAEPYRWGTVAIGGGGYVTGIVVHPTAPDRVYIRTDVGGAYRHDPSGGGRWVPLLDWVDPDRKNLYGIDAIALDPRRPDVVYVAAGKYEDEAPHDVLVSEDRGATWRFTGLGKAFGGNQQKRWHGEAIAVDPADSRVVWVGTRGDGLFVSRDGARTWDRAPDVPAGQPKVGIRSLAFDPVPGARGSRLFVGVYGHGVWRSREGAPFERLEDAPARVARVAVGPDGVLWATHDEGVARFDGAWRDVTPVAGRVYGGVAVDPADPRHVVVSETWGRRDASPFLLPLYRTTDAGATWAEVEREVGWETAPSWLRRDHFAAATAAIAFDPHRRGRLLLTDWYNVWWTEDVAAKPTQWVASPRGHEETVILSLVSPPSGPPLFSLMADNVGFRHADIAAYPTTRLTPKAEGTGLDYCERDPRRMVLVDAADWRGKDTGLLVSRDAGETWAKVAKPDGLSGKVAVSAEDPDRFVYLPARGPAWATADGGTTWAKVSGLPEGIVPTEYIFHYDHPLAADRADGRRFYAYASGGFFRSDDFGASFARVSSLPAADGIVNVKAAPGRAGLVGASLGRAGLWLSADAGARFERDAAFGEVRLFAWGRARPGTDVPTAFAFARRDGQWGLFRSTDLGRSWLRVNDDDHRLGDDPNVMEGDRQVFGRVYVGSGGRGVYYGEPATGPSAPAIPWTGEEQLDPDVAIPPAWAFGVLYGCYGDQARLERKVERLVAEGYPVDGVWSDSSFWDATTKGPRGYLNFRGDPSGWPDVRGLCERLSRRRVRFGVWVWDRLLDTGADFAEFERRGYFRGEPIVGNGWHNQGESAVGRYVDFENPEAAALWKAKMRPLLEQGLDFFKLDSGPRTAYVRTHFELTREGRESRGRGFVLSHVGRDDLLSVKRYPTSWTGDSLPDWKHDEYPDPVKWVFGGLREQVRMVADPRLEQYRYPFLANDTGGFRSMPGVGRASDELYMRWVQFSSFGAVMEVFGSMFFEDQNAPYTFGPAAQHDFLRYARLRLRLFPYLYSVAHRVRLAGRKMAEGDGENPLQYRLGPAFLVAPVLQPGATWRGVVLPAGERWVDYWTGVVHEGGRAVTVEAPADRLPLLVRAGSIVPMREEARAVELGSNEVLTLDVFPGGSSSFTLVEDDGLSEAYREGRFARTILEADDRGGELRVRIGATTGGFDGQLAARTWLVRARGRLAPSAVTVGGRPLARAAARGPEGPDGWWHDADGAWVRLRRPVSVATTLVVSSAAAKAPAPAPSEGGSGRVFREEGGEVRMEAEEATRFAHWRASPGPDGTVMVALPEGSWKGGVLRFDVDFTTPGRYALWLRSRPGGHEDGEGGRYGANDVKVWLDRSSEEPPSIARRRVDRIDTLFDGVGRPSFADGRKPESEVNLGEGEALAWSSRPKEGPGPAWWEVKAPGRHRLELVVGAEWGTTIDAVALVEGNRKPPAP